MKPVSSRYHKRFEKNKEMVQHAIDSSRQLFEKTLQRVNAIQEYILNQQDLFNKLKP